MSHTHTSHSLLNRPCFSDALLALSALALAGSTSLAQPVLITAPQTVAPNQISIVPTAGGAPVNLVSAQITVRGTTLTMNGRQTIASLIVEPNGGTPGILTHTSGIITDYSGVGTDLVRGLALTTSGNVTFAANGRFDGTGRGYPSDTGPGSGTGGVAFEVAAGGSHGGTGGEGSFNYGSPIGGPTNDRTAAPVDFGSGGGRDNTAFGGAGGGSLYISSNETITISGLINVNGGNFAGGEAGGGAGGSIWLSAVNIVGSGSLSANGGTANITFSGGGGGGRLSLSASSSIDPALILQCTGGSAWMRGGAGSIRTRIASQPSITTFHNAGLVGQRTDLAQDRSFDFLVLRGAAQLSHLAGEPSFVINVLNDLTIDASSKINVSGRGFASQSGSGAGIGGLTFDVAGGGGHGGNGGNGSANFGGPAGGITYGSISSPTTFGSGGGRDNFMLGGLGGGAVRLNVLGSVNLDGEILANGNPLPGGESGGGAAGSIWVSANFINGSGSLKANGGSGSVFFSGGGGGGRIAATAQAAMSPTLNFECYGGNGLMKGAAGSIYTKRASDPSTVIYDNNNTAGQRTDLANDRSFDNLIIQGRASLSHPAQEQGFTIAIAGLATIEANSGIDLSGRGFASATGPAPGIGGLSYDVAGGGGHGGNGGTGSPNFGFLPGGGVYGSVTQPVTHGSGGGRDNSTIGGRGGGAVKINLAGTLVNNGTIRANGNPTPSNESGAGAAGSIWITGGTISGNGTIQANGGLGNVFFSGGGGGGRIALNPASSLANSVIMEAFGGAGWQRGAAGSIFTKVGSAPSTTLFDNGGSAGQRTDIGEDRTFDFLIVRNRASLSHEQLEPDVTITVNHDVTVEPTGAIDFSGRGFGSDAGPGTGTGSVALDVGGGGGYGGNGGAGSPNYGSPPGGNAYGSRSSPIDFGSGGGRDNVSLGGSGGGAAKILVGGTLRVDGLLSTNGSNTPGDESGAGSGGALWLTASTIDGTGLITANGGNGNIFFSGGGGGGRVGLFSCNVLMPVANVRVAGGTGNRPGFAGTIYNGSSSVVITENPVGGDYIGGDFFQLGAVGTGNGPISFQWRRQDSSGEFFNLTEGQSGLFNGVNTSTLFVSAATCLGGGTFDCLICDSCGCVPTTAATIAVNSTGDINQDGGVDGADVEAFFLAWVDALPESDINNDGGVDGTDVDFFFLNWSGGC